MLKDSKLKVGLGVLAYDRPEHLKKLFLALQAEKIEEFSIFIDGADNELIKSKQNEIDKIISKVSWAKVNIIKRSVNLGLRKSVISAVSNLFEKNDSIILLEDDTIPRKGFFDYMYSVLNTYKNEKEVRSVCGYQIPKISDISKEISAHCVLRFIPWGWGTWKNRWEEYETNLSKLIKIINDEKIIDRLPTDMVSYISKNKDFLDSNEIWSINWSLLNYITNTFSVFPSRSLISNIGFDGSGVHCSNTNEFDLEDELTNKTPIFNIPTKPKYNQNYQFIMNSFLEDLALKIMIKVD